MNAKNGGAAFPKSATHVKPDNAPDYVIHGADGQSLRNWIATQALMGFMAAMAGKVTDDGVDFIRSSEAPENAAFHAYRYADAMLRESEK